MKYFMVIKEWEKDEQYLRICLEMLIHPWAITYHFINFLVSET